jgi:hypothetical protein
MPYSTELRQVGQPFDRGEELLTLGQLVLDIDAHQTFGDDLVATAARFPS